MIRKIQNLAKVQFSKENASPLKRLIWPGGLLGKFPEVESICHYQWNKYLMCFQTPKLTTFLLKRCQNPIKIDTIILITVFIVGYKMVVFLH